MKTIKYILFLSFLVGLFYMEASRMFIVETSITSSIIYPLTVLFCSFLLIKIGNSTKDRNYKSVLILVVWLYLLSVLHSVFSPFTATYNYVSLILPAFCLYLPQNILSNEFSKKLFDWGNIVVFIFLLSFYFSNYNNNIFIEVSSQNNPAYAVLFYAPILLCINNKLIRYIVLFITGFALFYSLKRSGIAAFVLGLVAFFYVTLKISDKKNKKFAYVLLCCLCLFGVGEITQDLLGDRIELLTNRFSTMEDIGSGRGDIYQATWKMIEKCDIFDLFVGHGYEGVAQDSPFACSAHNDYLEFMYDYGIIGLILLLSFVKKFGQTVINLLRNKSQFAAPAAFTFVVVIINSFFSHVFYYEWYFLLVAIFWGYLIWNVRQETILKT